MKKYLSLILTAAILLLNACNDSAAGNSASTNYNSENKSQSENQSLAGESDSEKEPQPQAPSEAPVIESSTESKAEQSSTEAQSISVSEPVINLPSSSARSSQKTEISAPNSASKPESKSESSAKIPESKPENSSVTPAENPKPPQSSSSVTESGKDTKPQESKEENNLNITITINGKAFSATLYGNETAKAFKKQLPLKLNMSELNGNEKYYYLSGSLPTNASRPSNIRTGDIMLYGSSCLVLFYEDFPTSYSYTPLGRIDNPAGLAAALGSGDVRVELN